MPNTRKNRRSGFLRRLYSPVNRGLQAVGNVGKEVTNTVGNVFGRAVTGVRRVGNTVTGRVNQGVGELVKSRRGGRRNRRNTMRRRQSGGNCPENMAAAKIKAIQAGKSASSVTLKNVPSCAGLASVGGRRRGSRKDRR